MALSSEKYNFNVIENCSSQPYSSNMLLKRTRVIFIPISNDLLELIHHNRETLYFFCLINMLGVNKSEAKDSIVLSQQFCLSIIDQQRQPIFIIRTSFFQREFSKKKVAHFACRDKFICFIINHGFYVITFWMHYLLFIIIYRRNKVICYWNGIFQVSDFLRLFIISFKYGLILLRHSSTHNALFLLPILLYSIYSYSKIYFLTKKIFLIFLSNVSLVALFSFSSLKAFLISLSILSLISSFYLSSLKRFLMSLIMVHFFKIFLI